MTKPARNALKGYTFQQYIFTLFLAKMDCDRLIKKIEVEAITESKFDDLHIIANENYRVQVKNYSNSKLSDIHITEDDVCIKGNSNIYNKDDNNILIINTDKIKTDTEFMGLPSKVIDKIIIIPITSEKVQDLLDQMFSCECRELQIIHFAFHLINSSKFEIEVNELPDLIRISTDLNEKTILIRETLDTIEKGILWIKGKPGIGKSHYVEELVKKYDDAIIYRFWTGAQDEMLTKRLQYQSFIDDIALAVFKSHKIYKKEELIEEIISQDKIIIIDGLDHVENYNTKEIHLFVEFIDLLKEARVIVLSRPLKFKLCWDYIELSNWNFSETALYLSSAYNICEYKLVEDIFEVTDGYPIMTYFVAEHYIKHGKIDPKQKFDNLYSYYDNLIDNTDINSLITIFATNNSFFLESEIKAIMGDSIISDAIMEFIDAYPYLFERKLNRISLIHDSFNTYLRSKRTEYLKLKDKVNQFVQSSLLQGNVNFMSRLSSFEFDEEFHKKILIMYSKTENFTDLLKRTLDFNSVASFYNQLQTLLEQHEGIFSIYQYYSFSLIYQMVNRNDLMGCEGLVYQILAYMDKHYVIEEELFSSDTMWNVYFFLKTGDKSPYKKFFVDKMYDPSCLYDIYTECCNEEYFFEEQEQKETLIKLEDSNMGQFDKQDIVVNHMIRAWLNKDYDDQYFKIIDNYFCRKVNLAKKQLWNLVEEYGIEDIWLDRMLSLVKFKLFELGKLEDINPFYNNTLNSLIKEFAYKGSFDVEVYVKSYIRLANHENRNIDIFSVNKFWTMYYNRKDYSVYKLDVALRIFEKLGYLNELESIEIIRKVMNQSEKGIRHLLTSYINMGEESLIDKLETLGAFDDKDFPIDIFDLMPDKINCIDSEHITRSLFETLSYNRYDKTINYEEIVKPLKSNYSNYILEVIAIYDYKIKGSIEDQKIKNKIKTKGIEIIEEERTKFEYIPFEHGYIHESDIEYIKKNKIGYFEVSKYPDGWYSCLPYIDVYSIYDINEIRYNYLKIIHNAIYAKVFDREYIGNWYLLIGNIPGFLKKYGIEIDWDIMFDTFKWFLEDSMIYDIENKI